MEELTFRIANSGMVLDLHRNKQKQQQHDSNDTYIRHELPAAIWAKAWKEAEGLNLKRDCTGSEGLQGGMVMESWTWHKRDIHKYGKTG